MITGHVLSRRHLLVGIAAGAAFAGLSGKVFASETMPIVVELFTSQGCSSCPPADAFMIDLAKRKDVIALSFNVDYWDYIGWKDTLAKPEHGKRAAEYVKALKLQSPYTPQMVIDGVNDVVGSNIPSVKAVLAKRAKEIGTATRVPVSLASSGAKIGVTIGGGVPPGGKADIWLVRTSSAVTVKIGKGENRDQTVTYTNAVRRIVHVGEWTGSQMSLSVPATEPDAKGSSDGVVILVQGINGGAILGAAHLKL